MIGREMKPDRHSATAVMMAVVRAYHTAGPKPHVFEDTVARKLVSNAECQTFERTSTELAKALDPDFVASCSDPVQVVHRGLRVGAAVGPLARARFVEDALEAALREGIAQYVIVGAGLETFAFRRSELASKLRVFEIDHPATSELKQRRVAEAKLEMPPNLHLVTADLEHESVASALERAPFDRAAPAFFAWPGVTMYLSRAAVLETLSSIATVAARGSHLVFDYYEPGALSADAPVRIRFVVQRAKQLGEPMFASVDPATLKSDLESAGFALAADLGPAEIEANVLPSGFRSVPHWRFVSCQRS